MSFFKHTNFACFFYHPALFVYKAPLLPINTIYFVNSTVVAFSHSLVKYWVRMATINVEDVLLKLTKKEKIDILSGVYEHFSPGTKN